MPRKKSQDTVIAELNASLKEAKIELACARIMYEDMLNLGVSEKALTKGEEVINEWNTEISIIQNEISAIVK